MTLQTVYTYHDNLPTALARLAFGAADVLPSGAVADPGWWSLPLSAGIFNQEKRTKLWLERLQKNYVKNEKRHL